MTDAPPDHAVIRFFGNAFITIGWLVLTLGGLCTVIVGGISLGGGGFHTSLGDWMLPLSMLAVGGAFLGLGRAIRRNLTKGPAAADAEEQGPADE